MPTDLARAHQLHGVQPVLPVPDVAAAADWFVRVLGFDVDFLQGEPAQHGRVRLGDRSWGDPVYIHLSHTAGDIRPCGQTRLHVGRDIDGLHAHAVAAGATVLQAPVDRPWGLREFTLQAPGAHVLVLGGEAASAAPASEPRSVIVCYRPRPGHEAALLALLRSHVPTLQRLGLATDRAPLAMQAADGSFVEVFEWASAAAIEAAHTHPEVHRMWAAFGATCDIVRLAQLAEAQNLFAEFAPLPP